MKTRKPAAVSMRSPEAWRCNKKRAAKIRNALLYGVSLSVSIVAMIAACIAAWPVINEWASK
jgi:hypothetical protein